jgi:hypothetical protein
VWIGQGYGKGLETMNEDDTIKLENIVFQLACPEKFTDVSHWHTGDGPFEQYCSDLQQLAIQTLKDIKGVKEL